VNLVNTQCRLATRPVGLPKPSDWQIVDEPARSPADGEFLVRVTRHRQRKLLCWP
jgi:NADPH-dependent curcumin reductase